jgi:hypothetical protein
MAEQKLRHFLFCDTILVTRYSLLLPAEALAKEGVTCHLLMFTAN